MLSSLAVIAHVDPRDETQALYSQQQSISGMLAVVSSSVAVPHTQT